MRALIQRVTHATVRCGEEQRSIEAGFLILLGVAKDDEEADADHLARKTVRLRIFENEQGKLDKSLTDIQGQALIVSQFTLYGDCRKGNRPSFDRAADADLARRLYRRYQEQVAAAGIPVVSGFFQEHMAVTLCNDGPVTILLESR
ncbi:MAG: D-tyrosyl-tRNA(Tyr) deacylase [Firmicutes bacterium]|nr:D-tyrosyl-tRNA(Tyr) deacylase [Bacillota bacterium]